MPPVEICAAASIAVQRRRLPDSAAARPTDQRHGGCDMLGRPLGVQSSDHHPRSAHMKRGEATRGHVAALVSGAKAIEIKVTIPDAQVDSTLARFGLTVDNDEERYIYFFDTLELDLHRAGIIARARRVVGDQHDSTVKFRPVEPESVAARWQTFRDFKIEADASEKRVTKSASFSMPVAKGLIKRIAAGDKKIQALFTRDQETFLVGMANRKIDFSRLVVYGPLRAHRWRFDDPGCPWPITAELWEREDGARMMETSIKAPAIQAAAALGGFMGFLAEFGAERDLEEQAKTRWAFDYYVTKQGKHQAQAATGKAQVAATNAAKAGTAERPRRRSHNTRRSR
jgi:hypothetical protein